MIGFSLSSYTLSFLILRHKPFCTSRAASSHRRHLRCRTTIKSDQDSGLRVHQARYSLMLTQTHTYRTFLLSFCFLGLKTHFASPPSLAKRSRSSSFPSATFTNHLCSYQTQHWGFHVASWSVSLYPGVWWARVLISAVRGSACAGVKVYVVGGGFECVRLRGVVCSGVLHRLLQVRVVVSLWGLHVRPILLVTPPAGLIRVIYVLLQQTLHMLDKLLEICDLI